MDVWSIRKYRKILCDRLDTKKEIPHTFKMKQNKTKRELPAINEIEKLLSADTHTKLLEIDDNEKFNLLNQTI